MTIKIQLWTGVKRPNKQTANHTAAHPEKKIMTESPHVEARSVTRSLHERCLLSVMLSSSNVLCVRSSRESFVPTTNPTAGMEWWNEWMDAWAVLPNRHEMFPRRSYRSYCCTGSHLRLTKKQKQKCTHETTQAHQAHPFHNHDTENISTSTHLVQNRNVSFTRYHHARTPIQPDV